MKKQVMTFLRDEEGLTIVEYAVAAGLIAAGVVASFTTLGGYVKQIIDYVAGQLAASPGVTP